MLSVLVKIPEVSTTREKENDDFTHTLARSSFLASRRDIFPILLIQGVGVLLGCQVM